MESFAPATDLRPDRLEKMYSKIGFESYSYLLSGMWKLCRHTWSPNLSRQKSRQSTKAYFIPGKESGAWQLKSIETCFKKQIYTKADIFIQ